MQFDRREFMRCALVAGVAMGTGSIVGACGGIRREGAPQPAREDRNVPHLDDTRRKILYYAAQAPSGHNSQPWRVRMESPEEWIVEADPRRRLPAVDPDNRELMLSLGAFTENLSLAAGTLGFDARIQVVAQNNYDRDFVRVSLRPDTPTPYPLERIANRRTVRQGYRPEEIRPPDVDALREAAGGRLFYFPQGSSHADCIREGTVECFRIQSACDEPCGLYPGGHGGVLSHTVPARCVPA